MRVLALVSVAIAVLWLPMSFTYPFGWDQGLFSWAGGAIVRGEMPYVDAWDMKGPLVYYIYALAEAVFGVHLWSMRVVDAALLIAATIAVLRAAEALTDAATARWAALIFFRRREARPHENQVVRHRSLLSGYSTQGTTRRGVQPLA